MAIHGLGKWVAVEPQEAPQKQGGLFLPSGSGSNAYKVLHVPKDYSLPIRAGDTVFIANPKALYEASYGASRGLFAHEDNIVGKVQEQISDLLKETHATKVSSS